MSHRKFSAPRHGSLGYLPRKRSKRKRGRIRAFPKDVPTPGVNEERWKTPDGVHLTGFMGYKAGMTHILRNFQRQGIKVITLETSEPVTIIETPPMKVIGVVGYIETAKGMRPFKTVWARNIQETARRRLESNWYKSKKNAFRHLRYSYNSKKNVEERAKKFELMKNRCKIIRIIAHTQPTLLNFGVKRAHIMEIQLNGGKTVEDKVNFAKEKLLGKVISVEQVFKQDDLIDVIGITRGKGFKGVVSRVGVRKLPRKTHKGLRKVACIGAWHPANVTFHVARAGQKGCFHRVSLNKKIYKIGKPIDFVGTAPEKPEGMPDDEFEKVMEKFKTWDEKPGEVTGMTTTDLTKKTINPISGFKNYGFVKNAFLMLKGSVMGPTKAPITLRHSLNPDNSKRRTESIELKFVDTASNTGKGRFQTRKEKREFYGITKKQLEKKVEREKKLAEKKIEVEQK